MRLYEISLSLLQCLKKAEEEAKANNGEISEYIAKELEGLYLKKESKIHEIGLLLKTLKAEIKMLKDERAALKKREEKLSVRYESLSFYLSQYMGENEKYYDSKVEISWREGERVHIEEGVMPPSAFCRTKVEVDKVAVKEAIKNGFYFEGIKLIKTRNIQIK
jgi:translation elongation factor EF-1beta